ncbi:MAG: hypothetical protein A3H27_12380 [Acidobacteria bacterium RIFCSPLOWO2_02_FULL_59_13]|nr:MAG: hypothetical protein A3H27_12380 [Acidobacteria bacterium RIFCSPLOWO2_02_FULL_59_13]
MYRLPFFPGSPANMPGIPQLKSPGSSQTHRGSRRAINLTSKFGAASNVGTGSLPRNPCAADVNDERAGRFQDTLEFLPKGLEPSYVFLTLNVAIVFLSDKAEWGTGYNEINRLRFETGHIFQGITEDDRAMLRFMVRRHLIQDAFYTL